jgi:hypothetical protein
MLGVKEKKSVRKMKRAQLHEFCVTFIVVENIGSTRTKKKKKKKPKT